MPIWEEMIGEKEFINMKKLKGFSIAGIVVGVLTVALLVIATIAIINGNNESTDFKKYDFYSVIPATKDNGNIGDHVKGSEDAAVLLFEYADYQCPACASMNERMNKIIEKMDGKVAIVYRNFLLSYHKNGTAAASAVEAAGLQGYWKEYADKMFKNQTEWESSEPSERTAIFDKYFEEVTEGKGDMEKFHADITSEEVSKKINFDMGIGKRINVSATPAFYVDGQYINSSEAGSLVINGKEITWDSARSGDKYEQLIKDIVEAKTGKE